MKAFEYLKSLIKADTLDSSKSFALVLSCIVGAVMASAYVSVSFTMFAVMDILRQTWIALASLCCASDVLWLEAESTRRWLIGKETIPVVKNKFDCTT